jgi:hypothetical protein
MSAITVRMATLDNGREEFDEVVAEQATIHLEKMSARSFSLVVETATEAIYVMVTASTKRGRPLIDAMVTGREPRP